jgi:uncharacterized protein
MSTSQASPQHSPAAINWQWGLKITLRDGIRLNATLYRPANLTEPTPVIFTMTPYTGQSYHETAKFFAAQGYVFLAVDVRGRGNSEGHFKPNFNEAKDGYDVVEWLAGQPFCNGKVAMWGGSYAGFAQWSTASAAPPHLCTIVPAASPYMGVDFPIRGNIASPYLVQWLTLVSGYTFQDRIFADQPLWNRYFKEWFESGAPFNSLDSRLGNPSPIFQEWLSHPKQDFYWDSHNPTTEQYAALSIPILTITGIYDGDQPGALTHYRKHTTHSEAAARARHYLIIGPWDHAGTRSPQANVGGLQFGPASLIDLPQLHLEWYEWTLKGGPKPAFLLKNVAYYVTGAEKWEYADTLDDVTARHRPFFLASSTNPTDVFRSGSLMAEPQSQSVPDSYSYDPTDTRLAAIEGLGTPEVLMDQRMIHAALGKQLIYHSAPFPTDTEFSGFFKLSVWCAIDQPDTDFMASVYEIDLNGGSVLLSSDWVRARYRQSLRTEELITTHDPLRYDFERFTFVSRQIKRGHRLRFVFGPLNSIHSQRNYNSGGDVSAETMADARTVTVKVFHDESHPSALYVPIGSAQAAVDRAEK